MPRPRGPITSMCWQEGDAMLPPKVIEQEAELVTANHELLPDLLIRLEQAGVELADGGGGLVAHRPSFL